MRLLIRLLWCVVVLPLVSAGAVANAQDYPSKPITIIVPFAPGGSSDLFARRIGSMIEKRWSNPVIVENKPGANAVIGSDLVARSEPDGHTLLLMTDAFTINPSLRKLPYDTATAFVPVTMMASTPLVFVAHPSLGVTNMAELVALAKEKPGSITFGSSGTGGPAHLSVELFSSLAGIKMKHVPYQGAAPALTDLIAGHISLLFNAFPPVVEQIQAGKITALGIGAPERAESMPDLPTVAEQGYPNFEGKSWFGLAVPGKTPPAVIEKLSGELTALLNDPDLVAWMKSQGFDKVANSPEEFGTFITRQTQTWAGLINELGIQQQ